VTITEGPVREVANVLCDLDAYSAREARLGTGATYAPDNPMLLAAGYEAVAVVNLAFWRPFVDVEPDLMLGDGDCLHVPRLLLHHQSGTRCAPPSRFRRDVGALRAERQRRVRVARTVAPLNQRSQSSAGCRVAVLVLVDG